MLDRSYVNLIDPATGRRPLPQFGRVDIKSSGSSTNFNGLQLSLHRPFSGGFLFGAQYMWSHAFDEGSLGGGESQTPQNVACRSLRVRQHEPGHPAHAHDELGVRACRSARTAAPSDERHAASTCSAAGNLSGVMQARTGRPLTITVSRSTGDLPDGNNRESASGRRAGRRRRFPRTRRLISGSTSRRSPCPREAPGATSARNTLRGPGLLQVDLALQKRFRSTERATSSSDGRRSTCSTA